MKKYFLTLLCITSILLIMGCQKDISQIRETSIQNGTDDIVIGIPGPISYMKDLTGFYNGIMMALEEINEDNGIYNRKLSIRMEDDQGTFNEGIKIAQEFASQEDMVAVIGHWNSYITLPAARVYNDAGLVMLSPIVSHAELTKKGYENVFQNTINDNEMGRQMAEYARENGYERIVVYYADNDYGKGLSNAFENDITDHGGMVVDRVTEFANDQERNMAFNKWEALEYDAVFIADSMPHAGQFIRKLRGKDKRIPIFAGDGLDIAELPSLLGEAAEGMVIATMYRTDEENSIQKEFIRSYRSKYKKEPDVWAVQGYDSIKLLAYAMEKADSPSPSQIAQILHSDSEWTGVMGSVKFNSNGEMIGRSIYKKIIKNGKMEFLDD